MRNQVVFVSTMVVIFTLGLSTVPAMALNVTLADIGLMSLDWYLPWGLQGAIVEQRDIPGPGVEFDIYYPSIESPYPVVYYVSWEDGGTSSLVGIDISMYDNFELKFTLVSVDGVSAPDTGGTLAVGALINFDSTHGFQPKGIDFLSDTPYGTTAISSTSTDADRISIIGFTAYIPPSWKAGWNPSGTTVTLLVEAAPDAVAIPEPATVLLLGLGGVALLIKRKAKNVK